MPHDASHATRPRSGWLHSLRTTAGIMSFFRPVPSCCLEILTAPKLQTAPAVCGQSTKPDRPPQPKQHPPCSAVPPAPEKHDPREKKKKSPFNRRGEDSQSSRNPRGSLCCCWVAARTRPRRLRVPAARLLLVLTRSSWVLFCCQLPVPALGRKPSTLDLAPSGGTHCVALSSAIRLWIFKVMNFLQRGWKASQPLRTIGVGGSVLISSTQRICEK